MNVLILLACCHTVIVDPNNGNPLYNSSSPDELALVNAAKFFGIKFINRDIENNITLIMPDGEVLTYALLNILEFNSDRKRMSVIVKEPGGKIILMCKGADNVIKQRIAQT